MLYFKDTYATIWKIQDVKERYSKVQLSTSEKDIEGNYVWSNWFTSFVGDAHKKINTLHEKDRIKMTGKVNRRSVQNPDETWKTFTNVTIFDFEKVDSISKKQDTSFGRDSTDIDQEDSDELPF